MNTSRATAFLLVVANSAASVEAQAFRGLGFLPGAASSTATDISEDGTTVVGYSGIEAARWRPLLPAQGLGGVPGFSGSGATATSANGNIAAGTAVVQPNTVIGFRWTGAPANEALTGMRSVGAISGDGSTVVGYAQPPVSEVRAVRWTQGTGTVELGPLSNPGQFGVGFAREAHGANSNGSVIVGIATIAVASTPVGLVFGPTPFIWDPLLGARTIPSAPGIYPRAGASDVTPDGQVVVGWSDINNVDQLFRWTQTGGYSFIDVATPTAFAGGVRISGNGEIIISERNYWTAAGGARVLTDVLTEAGCDFTGWTIQNAVGISFDGRTLAGNGINPMGQNEAWIATIPAPGSLAALLGLASFFASRRRRQ